MAESHYIPTPQDYQKAEAMLTDEQRQQSLERSAQHERGFWKIKPLKTFTRIEQQQSFDRKLPNQYLITNREGQRSKVQETDILYQSEVNPYNQIVEIPARAVNGIARLHLKTAAADAKTNEMELQSAIELISKKLPPDFFNIKGKISGSQCELDLEQPVGFKDFASRDEMLQKGIIEQEDIRTLDGLKSEVIQLNFSGSIEDKLQFVRTENQRFKDRKVHLEVIQDTIVPIFETKREPTTKITVGFKSRTLPPADPKDDIVKQPTIRNLHTISIGPNKEAFPGSYAFKGNEEMKMPSVQDLYKKSQKSELMYFEKQYLEEYKRAQEFWWNNGIIKDPDYQTSHQSNKPRNRK